MHFVVNRRRSRDGKDQAKAKVYSVTGCEYRKTTVAERDLSTGSLKNSELAIPGLS